MANSRVATWYRQLSPARFVTHALAEVTRKALNPAAAFTYSQYGEDKVLWSLLEQKATGSYVDVGCHHPTRLSNTYALYLRGWSGIAIDANEEFSADFARLRPRDRFVRACVSDKPVEVEFKIYKDRALSSLHAVSDPAIGASQATVVRVERLKARRLDEILSSNHAPMGFDLLSVDVEGQDMAVIMSLDFNACRPKVVAVEAHDVVPLLLVDHPITRYLVGFGYELKAFQGPNLFFRRAQ